MKEPMSDVLNLHAIVIKMHILLPLCCLLRQTERMKNIIFMKLYEDVIALFDQQLLIIFNILLSLGNGSQKEGFAISTGFTCYNAKGISLMDTQRFIAKSCVNSFSMCIYVFSLCLHQIRPHLFVRFVVSFFFFISHLL